jgi:WXG100 family type VII secretion target
MSTSDYGGYIHVNYNGVNDVLDTLQRADQAIQTLFEELNPVVTQMMNIWVGSSAEQYASLQNRWNQDLADMGAMISANTATLQEMAYTYSSTDNNLAFQWADIR